MDAVRDPLLARAAWSFLPPRGGDAADQVRACLAALRERLAAAGLADREILRLTFFLDATEDRGYASLRNTLASLVREALGPLPPPASFVAQPPEQGRRAALEAAVVARRLPGLDVRRRSLEGLTYVVVEGPDFREVHGGGLASEGRSEDPSVLARQAFEKMAAVLRRERMTFGQVVRQWNYIEDITGLRTVRGKRVQNYQAFNDVRSLFYGQSAFSAGYPAATGIGQDAGGIVLEFVALEAGASVKVVPCSNPRQADAHRYSDRVLVGSPIEEMSNKTSPKFERAKLVGRGGEALVYVSGTAAVLGQKSVGSGDVEAQTRTTIGNVEALPGELAYLRAYVKRARDIPKVRRACERAFGPVLALYLKADVCRKELLIELEGVKCGRAGPRRRA